MVNVYNHEIRKQNNITDNETEYFLYTFILDQHICFYSQKKAYGIG